MGLCAMRIGEALSIRFADIDFDKGTVQIRRTLWNGAVSQPKTPSSRRTLVLPQRVLDCLVRLRSTSDGTGSSSPPAAVYQSATQTFTPDVGHVLSVGLDSRQP